jgi:hypothetical protein
VLALWIRQVLLPPEPSAVADELPGPPDDVVAGDEDRDPVVAVGAGDLPDGRRAWAVDDGSQIC